ncbi:MAG: MBOAT family protein [Lachnospiraceae bacterium]|nr:MBOAT family protein [Lachnospiraceae bacterium]
MPANFTSFYFLCFYACILIIYYLIPQKTQWVFLLMASTAFYLLTGNGWLILYPAVASLTAYISMRVMTGTEDKKKRSLALLLSAALLIGALIVLKYINFGINTVNAVASLWHPSGDLLKGFHFLVPLGISFYTFSILGYVVDVYNEIAAPQKNFFKMAAYGMYFPSILSGPILKYREDGEQFFVPHPFDYRQVTFGLQRMVWGFFKTLVISERMNLVVNTVYDNYMQYPGIYIWIATVCYAFQLYTNFSGSMDIVLGMSQTFGIRLPENFETPFFSKNISEYWRRWHITLGVWMKEYVFYPLLRTEAFGSLGKKLRKRFGKKRGKQLTTFLAMFLLWFTVGIWHGGEWKFVIGSGLLHWFYIVSGELLAPLYGKMMEKLHINPKSRWVDGFRILRTFFLANIGFVFFRAPSAPDAFRMLKEGISVWNLGALFDGSLLALGLDAIEAVIAIVSLLILLTVSILQQKGSVRERIEKKKLPVRFLIWYALLFYTILLGHYGPDFSAAEFIYQGF